MATFQSFQVCYTWKSCYTSESELKRAYLTTICMKSFHMWSTLWSILWSESEMAKMFSQLIFPPLGTTRKLAGVAELVRFVQQKQKGTGQKKIFFGHHQKIGWSCRAGVIFLTKTKKEQERKFLGSKKKKDRNTSMISK